jgi:Tfp pilus assembly protein PilF
MLLAVVLALLLAGGGMYYYTNRSDSDIPAEVQAGIADYTAGRTEAARGALEKAVRDYPSLALPHIYLARIARDDGDFATAGSQLKTAVELEPQSAVAQRELGAFFLARGTQFANQKRQDLAAADYDAARRSYVRAIQLDPADSSAQGFLGCALARLGRTQEAATWLGRVGRGPWSVCAPANVADSGGGSRPRS